ncbi:CHAT domain-containing protein [Spirulina subsalsa FACHB-351]|uniref:CHAT domain-containing protein n=1 Tax=Spirulina subsalsa FACHB-351 TaxID=234711 RepID=A0ABT3L6H2_9CYAN|nr:CHAT domain-containing protein [Spirulina subsalsa]MCW6037103.1 CHAT domain-containing protein [Spirulina subsalsa FACHB-351]
MLIFVNLLMYLPQQKPLLAQTITPANDGTGTLITPNGNQIQITGGTLSSDGKNLFHSFQQFGLNPQQIADFLSNPQHQNILGRIVGGDPSVINGLLQVTGSNANLYLMNPAGIIFGPEAQLNVPGDFFATTATGIGFGDNNWFNAWGENDHSNLTGTPFQFAFDLNPNGSIINAGQLDLNPGQTLTLLGGQVINTGTLSTSAGTIIISAVPEQGVVTLSQPGQLLSLEIKPPRDNNGQILPITPLDLPQLLTGSPVETGLTVQDNQVTLNATGTVLPNTPGLTILGGQMDVSGLTGGNFFGLGEIVGVFNGTINASGELGGGNVFLGGDYRGQGTIPNAWRTVVNGNSRISADGLTSGDGGRVILWADDFTGFYGEITVRGGAEGGDGGFVEVSGEQDLVFRGKVDLTAAHGLAGTLLLDPENIQIVAFDGANDNEIADGEILAGDSPGATFTISATALTDFFVGTVILEATNNITIDPGVSLSFGSGVTDLIIRADADRDGNGVFSMDSSQSLDFVGTNLTIEGAEITLGNLSFNDAGNVTLTTTQSRSFGGNILFNSIDTLDNVTIAANGTVRGTGVGVDYTITTDASSTVSITHDGGPTNAPFVLNDATVNGLASGILLTDSPDIEVTSGSYPVLPSGGAVNPHPQVTITSVNSPPTVQPLSVSLASGQSVSFGYTQLLNQISDVNADWITSITLSNFSNQGTLRVNGIPVVGDSVVLSSGDVVEFTPFSTASGELILFRLSASDGVALGSNNILAVLPSSPVSPMPPPGSVTPSSPEGEAPIPEGSEAFNFRDCVGCEDLLLGNKQGNFEEDDFMEEGESFDEVMGDGSSVLDMAQEELDRNFTSEFEEYFEGLIGEVPEVTLGEAQDVLNNVARQADITPAFVYVSFGTSVANLWPPDGSGERLFASVDPLFWDLARNEQDSPFGSESDELRLVLITPQGRPMIRTVFGVTRGQVMEQADQLRRTVTNARRPRAFMEPAQQLYQWVIAPLEQELEAREIDNIAFVMDGGMRSLPIAALHDGNQFLIERFSLGMMPSLALTDTTYRDLRNSQVLAMGASEFNLQDEGVDLLPLPGVPFELELITQKLWRGSKFLNEQFTVENLRATRAQSPYGIVHLGTHGAFKPGRITGSYLALHHGKVPLPNLRDLGLHNPPVDLLVLSACQTALGDRNAELGFAGLAVASGARTALGSLWYVSDQGTATLMASFYQALQEKSTKTEALQKAQLAMLRGQARVEAGELIMGDIRFPLSPELAALGDANLTHPYYWSSFTLIGSPW